MKKRTKKILLLSAGALVLVVGSFLACGIYSFMASPFLGEEIDDQPDAVLINNFHSQKAEFEQLREMVIQDQTMSRVDNDWTDPSTFDTTRVAEYRRLFKVIGTPRGVIAYDRERIRLISSSHGWFSSGSTKGYLYLKKPPKNLADSLDNYGWHTKMDTFAVRHIEGNWYLFFDRS
ncbi:hypothetical protein BH10ACI3_BH10ACI3_08860 [soil metagenome]